MATSLNKTNDTADLLARQAVVDQAVQTGVGQWASRVCGSCGERTLSMDVGVNGIIKYHCHRASCGFQGMCYQSGLSVHSDSAKPLERGNNPLTEDLHRLGADDVTFFDARYGIPGEVSKDAIYRTESRYALPIYSPRGLVRGYITRRPYEGSPADTEANRSHYQYSMKALTYLESDEAVQSWYGDKDCYKTVLVEDSLSALRIASWDDDVRGVAILGTGLNAQKVQEIQRAAKGPVYIALDADATGQAFAMARKWGMAFKECRVVVLQRDIKDMSIDELNQLPI